MSCAETEYAKVSDLKQVICRQGRANIKFEGGQNKTPRPRTPPKPAQASENFHKTGGVSKTGGVAKLGGGKTGGAVTKPGVPGEKNSAWAGLASISP